MKVSYSSFNLSDQTEVRTVRLDREHTRNPAHSVWRRGGRNGGKTYEPKLGAIGRPCHTIHIHLIIGYSASIRAVAGHCVESADTALVLGECQPRGIRRPDGASPSLDYAEGTTFTGFVFDDSSVVRPVRADDGDEVVDMILVLTICTRSGECDISAVRRPRQPGHEPPPPGQWPGDTPHVGTVRGHGKDLTVAGITLPANRYERNPRTVRRPGRVVIRVPILGEPLRIRAVEIRCRYLILMRSVPQQPRGIPERPVDDP